jgi:intracellular multiplication protein IcmC
MRARKYILQNLPILLLLLFTANAMAAAGDGGFYGYVKDFGYMITALKENLPAVVRLLNATAYVTGIWFIFSAIHELRIYGQARTMMPGNIQLNGPVTKLILGALLLFLPGTIDMASFTLWGYGKENIQEYYTVADTVWAPVFNGVLALVRVVGYIAFIRGILLLSRSAGQQKQPGMFGKGLIFLIGGILSINIIGTIKMIQATFGLGG